MTNTPRSDAEAMWATSGTGDEFQCVDLSFARELEREINELRLKNPVAKGKPCECGGTNGWVSCSASMCCLADGFYCRFA